MHDVRTSLATARRKELKGSPGAGAFRQCGVTALKVGLRGGNQWRTLRAALIHNYTDDQGTENDRPQGDLTLIFFFFKLKLVVSVCLFILHPEASGDIQGSPSRSKRNLHSPVVGCELHFRNSKLLLAHRVRRRVTTPRSLIDMLAIGSASWLKRTPN
jgi:hypothetical protein